MPARPGAASAARRSPLHATTSTPLMRVSHYAGNRLALVAAVLEVVYEILGISSQNRRIRGRESLVDAFGFSEQGLLEYLVNQYSLPGVGTEAPPDHLFWKVVYDVFRRELDFSPDMAHSLLKQLQSIMEQVADGSYPAMQGASTLSEGLPGILESLIDSWVLTTIGMKLPELTAVMRVLRTIADSMDLVSSVVLPNVNYLEWEDDGSDDGSDPSLSAQDPSLSVGWDHLPPLRLRLDIGSGWFLLVVGNYEVTLPSLAEELFEWTMDGPRGASCDLRIPSVRLVEMEAVELWQEKDGAFIRLPFPLASVDRFEVEGIRVSLAMTPEMDPEHAVFGSAHRFREAVHTRRGSAGRVQVDLSVDAVHVDVAPNPVVMAIVGLFGGIGIGSLVRRFERSLSQRLTDAINGIGSRLDGLLGTGTMDLSGLDLPDSLDIDASGIPSIWDEVLDFLGGVFPNARAASFVQVDLPPAPPGKEPLTLAFAFDDLVAEADGNGLVIVNSSGDTGGGWWQPPLDGGPGHPTPPTFPGRHGDDLQPSSAGIPGPASHPRDGNGRHSPSRTDPEAAEAAVRNLYAEDGKRLDRDVAMTLLTAAGFTAPEVVAMRWGDLDLGAGQKAERPIPPAAREALQRMRESASGSTSLVFERGGREPALRDVARAVETVMSFATDPFADPLATLTAGAECQTDSPLPSTYGDATDPAWVGLSTNCHVARTLYRRMQDQGAFDVGGAGSFDGFEYTYEITTSGVRTDLSGSVLADRYDADLDADVPNRGAGLVLPDTTVRIVSNAGAESEFTARVVLPLAPVSYEPGDLRLVTPSLDDTRSREPASPGTLGGKSGLRDLLYPYFVFLRVDASMDAGLVVDSVVRVSGEDPLVESGTTEALLTDVARDAYRSVWEIPVLYDPYGFLGGEYRDYYAEDGWIVVMKRYADLL